MISKEVENRPRLVSIGTANPGRRYTQEEVLEKFGVTDKKIKRLFQNSHIRTRYLTLPDSDDPATTPVESSAELRNKHFELGVDAAARAINVALDAAALKPVDIDYIAVVTSTGFLCPGLSAHLIKQLGMRQNIGRVDVLGMGCNAGLNGMQPVVNYCRGNPGSNALLVCVEVCSAAYVFDDTMRTSVVNSIFGDGAAAAVFNTAATYAYTRGPAIIDFESHIFTEAIDTMRFDFDGMKNSFFLDPDIPYLIGANFERPVKFLLDKFGLRLRDISHWVIHSGGRKVIDSIKYNIGLTAHDVRHTESVLKDFGNLSSGSFLFSHARLMEEQCAQENDYVMMATMGPGATIECCLARY
jgi:3,5-dihydroxyphenylacetyl-CoA synthase